MRICDYLSSLKKIFKKKCLFLHLLTLTVKDMYNPFEEIITKLDQILLTNERILLLLNTPIQRKKIPFSVFCKENGITRPTAYAWRDRGLIKIEKVGGRNYVLTDSILVDKKWQRKKIE